MSEDAYREIATDQLARLLDEAHTTVNALDRFWTRVYGPNEAVLPIRETLNAISDEWYGETPRVAASGMASCCSLHGTYPALMSTCSCCSGAETWRWDPIAGEWKPENDEHRAAAEDTTDPSAGASDLGRDALLALEQAVTELVDNGYVPDPHACFTLRSHLAAIREARRGEASA